MSSKFRRPGHPRTNMYSAPSLLFTDILLDQLQQASFDCVHLLTKTSRRASSRCSSV